MTDNFKYMAAEMEAEEILAQAAISASDSKYLKGLVEALNAISNEDACNVHDMKAYAKTALQNLPEDLR